MLTELFWRKVQKSNACWLWTGSVNSEGYGQIRQHRRLLLAHRLAYEECNGPVPAGLMVLHRCDNPRCVNPDHLFVGNNSDNMRDCAAKGRSNFQTKPLRGERHPQSKVTWDVVRKIRSEYAHGGVTKLFLARKFGIGACQVGNIISGKHWREDAWNLQVPAA